MLVEVSGIQSGVSAASAGLIQPDLLDNGQVCVDMGEPILEADRIPTTLPASQVCPIRVTGCPCVLLKICSDDLINLLADLSMLHNIPSASFLFCK